VSSVLSSFSPRKKSNPVTPGNANSQTSVQLPPSTTNTHLLESESAMLDTCLYLMVPTENNRNSNSGDRDSLNSIENSEQIKVKMLHLSVPGFLISSTCQKPTPHRINHIFVFHLSHHTLVMCDELLFDVVDVQ
jgi:hypothetical protein